MKLAQLIAIAAIATILAQTSVLAQENPDPIAPAAEKSAESTPAPASITPVSEKSAESAPAPANPASITPVLEKKYSIGPAIEFGSGGTSFGITGRSTWGSFSFRPLFLFGYKPTVTGSNVSTSVNGAFTQTDSNTIAGSLKGGTAVGASITYDFKSTDGKLAGYVGPRYLVGRASGTGAIASGTTFQIDAVETTGGLTLGADYAITPDLTAGINATYSFYKALNIGSTSTQYTSGGLNLGINVMYGF
jgi:Opacity family porin protein